MKNRSILILILMAAFCAGLSAQSVVITGKKITYKRGKSAGEGKETFTVNYPKVKASTAALSKKIESTISYDINIRQEIRNDWLGEADYEVGYNKNGILSITLTTEGSSAYPSSTTKYVVVDLKTGLRATPATAFTNTAGLLALVKKAKDNEVRQACIDIKKEKDYNEDHPEELFKESAKYHPVKLDHFTVSDKGVTFHHDYDFAHVVQALEPSGEFLFTWAELKPYIKRGGLFSRMKG